LKAKEGGKKNDVPNASQALATRQSVCAQFEGLSCTTLLNRPTQGHEENEANKFSTSWAVSREQARKRS
jgi:hypothetical protein